MFPINCGSYKALSRPKQNRNTQPSLYSMTLRFAWVTWGYTHCFFNNMSLSRHRQTSHILQNTFRIQPRSWLPKIVKTDPFKLLGIYCSCWRTDLYSAENLTLREVDQKYLGNFEMWCWGRMEMICWTHCLKMQNKKSRGYKEYYTHNNMKEG
jgi:hypothetical protein